MSVRLLLWLWGSPSLSISSWRGSQRLALLVESVMICKVVVVVMVEEEMIRRRRVLQNNCLPASCLRVEDILPVLALLFFVLFEISIVGDLLNRFMKSACVEGVTDLFMHKFTWEAATELDNTAFRGSELSSETICISNSFSLCVPVFDERSIDGFYERVEFCNDCFKLIAMESRSDRDKWEDGVWPTDSSELRENWRRNIIRADATHLLHDQVKCLIILSNVSEGDYSLWTCTVYF